MAKRKRRRHAKAQALTPGQWVIFALTGLALVLGLAVSLAEGEGLPSWESIFSRVGLEAQPLPAEGLAAAANAVHFIDVGQGDATLLQSGGEYCLVDAGEPDSEDALLAYLRGMGVSRLKLLVMSHPHADHIGSMAAVLQEFPVDEVLLPDFDKAPYPTTATFERVMQLILDKGIPAVTAAPGQRFALGNGAVQVLDAGVETENYNDLSQVLHFEAGGLSVLLTGDGEKAVEKAALGAGGLPHVQVFKAAHHGSNTSNTEDFLWAVRPRYVVVSCGANNSYGHPHKEPVVRFAALGAQVLRTDENGSVVLAEEENGLRLYTARTPEGGSTGGEQEAA